MGCQPIKKRLADVHLSAGAYTNRAKISHNSSNTSQAWCAGELHTAPASSSSKQRKVWGIRAVCGRQTSDACAGSVPELRLCKWSVFLSFTRRRRHKWDLVRSSARPAYMWPLWISLHRRQDTRVPWCWLEDCSDWLIWYFSVFFLFFWLIAVLIKRQQILGR